MKIVNKVTIFPFYLFVPQSCFYQISTEVELNLLGYRTTQLLLCMHFSNRQLLIILNIAAFPHAFARLFSFRVQHFSH